MNNTLGDKISNLRKQHKMSQYKMAEALNECGIYITNAAISAWEKNNSLPNGIQLLAICKVLGITDIYREFIGENPNDPLTKLNDKGREKAMEYVSLLLLSDQYIKESAEIIPFKRKLPLSLQGTSAGTGDFMNDENFEIVEVGEDVPIKADFGVHLNGNSMEPRYKDNEIVWVQKSDNLRSGEIGIFYMDGMTYCKQLKKDQESYFLISLNSDYPPITVSADNSLKIFGRVLS